MIIHYKEQLKNICDEAGISVLKAYKLAGVHTSTYYRNTNGENELQFETAQKIAKVLDGKSQDERR